MKHKCNLYTVCSFGILLNLPLQAQGFLSVSPPKSSLCHGSGVSSHSFSSDGASRNHKRSDGILGTATSNSESEAAATDAPTILKSYEHDGWKLTYRTNAGEDDDDENDSDDEYHNVLLIHPVGIGLASWFWEPFLKALGETNTNRGSGTPKRIRAYAPNLIGCGISEGSDAWDPDQRGMFVPLGWVKGCEALVNQINDENSDKQRNSSSKWTVVTQGGLAPIGVLLAARNPEWVERLVMASPPVWKEMTQGVPPAELERNYNFLRSPLLGKLAFHLLERRGIVEFFSNQFLFTEDCDEVWLDNTEREMCEAARPPVQNFNAGMCMNRGLLSELVEVIPSKIPQVWVLQGENDKRPREEYQENMSNCELVTIPGTTNVVPWEEPEALADLLVDRIVQ